jgi:hypothetical protein
VAGSAEEPRKVETAELLEAKAERDRKAALAQRIVDAAKSGGAFTKARKIWLPAKVAESLGLFEGEYGAMNLVELGHGEAVATWLESTPDGDAA